MFLALTFLLSFTFGDELNTEAVNPEAVNAEVVNTEAVNPEAVHAEAVHAEAVNADVDGGNADDQPTYVLLDEMKTFHRQFRIILEAGSNENCFTAEVEPNQHLKIEYTVRGRL